jgi:hypothetical protein
VLNVCFVFSFVVVKIFRLPGRILLLASVIVSVTASQPKETVEFVSNNPVNEFL